MPNFPIDERGHTFNAEGREVKLSPAMQQLVRALNAHGHVDPIRDFGRGTGVSTAVALMQRGILREAKRSHGVHMPATARVQVEEEAYAEDARREAEAKAHAADPTRWVQVDEGCQKRHIRSTVDGRTVEIYSTGHNHWQIIIGGDLSNYGRSAGGSFEEARAAADRVECEQAWDGASEADEAFNRTAEKYAAAMVKVGEAQRAGVHGTHCCVKHGCKYGEDDCPVELGKVIQEHPCEECDDQLDIEQPRHPEGTPEYAAYRTELRTELDKFAKGEEPYPYPQVNTPAETRDRHSSDYWESATQGLPREPAFTTPAEARTGVSDRTAAALEALAVVRRHTLAMCRSQPVSWPPAEMEERLDIIEQALRAGDAR